MPRSNIETRWNVNEDGQIVVRFECAPGHMIEPIVLPRRESALIARAVLAAQAPEAPAKEG
jgi:hypothetical protein